MSILYGFLIFVHVVVAILLIVAILMQRSKGGGLAGIAGGAQSQAVFGGRGAATIVKKGTIVLAIVFGINALLLGVLSKGIGQRTSVTQQAIQEERDALQNYFDGGSAEIPAGDQQATGTEATE